MNRPWRTRLSILVDEVRLEASIIRHKLSDKKLLLSFFKLFILLFVLFLLANLVSFFYTEPDRLLQLVEGARAFGPLIIIGLIILEVVLAPVPGFVVMVAAGYLYGPWLGALYSYIGNVVGSLLAFFLAKHFGRPFVERIVSHRLLVRYDKFFASHRKSLMFFYALPVVPVDILSFVCGLSSMAWRKFLLVIVVGFIPNTLILALVGDQLSKLEFVATLFYALLFLVVFAALTWLFQLLAKRMARR